MAHMDYLKFLVEEIHSTTVATIGSDGHPQTRIIDMMYYDADGVYFLTAKGKAFYEQHFTNSLWSSSMWQYRRQKTSVQYRFAET